MRPSPGAILMAVVPFIVPDAYTVLERTGAKGNKDSASRRLFIEGFLSLFACWIYDCHGFSPYLKKARHHHRILPGVQSIQYPPDHGPRAAART